MSPTELDLRKTWAIACIGTVINSGRTAGWLRGEPLRAVPDADRLRVDAEAAADASPMRTLAARLGLTPQEVDVLWLLACVELEPALATACQALFPAGMQELTAQMIERLVAADGVHVDGLLFARLHRLGLIEMAVDPRVPLFRRGLRVSDRVLDLARGRLGLDPELSEVARLASALDLRRATTGFEIALPDELRSALRTHDALFVIATGARGSGRATLLRHAIAGTGRAVLDIDAARLSGEVVRLTRQLRAIVRECRLHDASPLLTGIDEVADRASLIDQELLREMPGAVFATARETCAWRVSRTSISIATQMPDESQRAKLWRSMLPSTSEDVATACAARYTVGPGAICAAAATAKASANEPTTAVIHAALRAQFERRLSGLARRIETRQQWHDLVLPVDQFDLLSELVARVRHREHVLGTWGFADKVGRGLGVAALLSGPPGTGKTMIAGLVAKELGLDLFQVDLSRIVSKYIGETEKQLAELFEVAESGHAILLFDEADSLFAKRTEVRSSNDRYANLEVNYLLQRMEAFSGICILTTNHETAIDAAFMRRLAFHIRVPMPDEAERAMLWQTLLPERAEHEQGLDFGALAGSFEMSGGYIRNAVLRAAFIAADEGRVISNGHLVRAARAEYEAMGKLAMNR